MGSERSAERILVGSIWVAFGLVVFVMRPFVEAFVFATVLAAALHPFHRKLTRKLGGRPKLSAALLSLGLVLTLLLPLGGLGGFVVRETLRGVDFVLETLRSDGMAGLIDRLPDSVQHLVERVLGDSTASEGGLGREIQRQTTAHGGQVAGWLSRALAATGSLLFGATMMLIAFYFLVVDGLDLVAWIEKSSPLRKGQIRELLTEFRNVSTAVLVSSVVTSGVQALAALVGYLLTGVPHPFFFAFVTFFLAFVPAVGAGGVCLLAALLLVATGHPWAALFLGSWGLVVVGLVDNLIKPWLVQRGMQLHGAIVFFSLLGGLAVFGPVGLLVGPLAISLLLALVRIYERDYRRDRESTSPAEAPSTEPRPVQPASDA